ncbi:MAG: hypothetical protein J3K34DRAFT_523676 [Monoraphidium minutum]|nr:MAG: hypothetical protein J3K34DRAFT_523676 [Monoraphidium minutum]
MALSQGASRWPLAASGSARRRTGARPHAAPPALAPAPQRRPPRRGASLPAPAFYASGPVFLAPTAQPSPTAAHATSAAASASAASAAAPPPDLFSLLRPAGYLDVGAVPPGDTLQHTGDLVIHGSVARGARIIASGDVICLGCLQGSVHAGADLGGGHNGAARVVALEMRGARVRIAGVKTLGDAKVTLPGPHCAYVAASGPSSVIQLHPLGRTRPTPSIAALGASFWRWKRAYPAAMAAFVTGLYALAAGAALVAAPKTVLGLLFDVAALPSVWIQVGGVLFATFGLQYLGTAWGDWRRVAAARRSHSEHVAGMEHSRERDRAGAAAAAAAAAPPAPPRRGGANTPVPAIDTIDFGSAAAAGGGGGEGGWDDEPGAGGGGLLWDGVFSAAAAAASAEHERRASNLLHSSTAFYRATVWSRLVLAAAFVGLVAGASAPPGLLVLAGVNAAGAASMALALRQQWLMHMMGGK